MAQDENVPATSNVSTNLPANTQNLPAMTGLGYVGLNTQTLVFMVAMFILSACVALSGMFTPTDYDQFSVYAIRIANVGGLLDRMSNTLAVPPSYGIAMALGQSVAASGLLMSVSYIGAGIAIVIALYVTGFTFLPQKYFRENMVLGCLVQAGALCGQGLLMSPAFYNLSGGLRWYLILLMCYIRGLGCAVNIYDGKSFTARVIPKRDLMLFATNQTVYQAIGIGLGPFGFSIFSWAFGAAGTNFQNTIPFYVQAQSLLVMAAAYVNVAPKSHEEVAERVKQKVNADKEDEEKEKREGKVIADGISYDEMDEEQLDAAKHVWCGGIACSMEKGTSVAALEVASALLLESKYGISVSTCGFLVSLSFLVCSPFLQILDRARESGMLSERTLLLPLCALGPAGSLLLLTQASTLFGLPGKPYLLIVGDCLMFPATYYANGLFDGWALKFSDKNLNGWYTQQRYISAAFVGISMTRGIASTLARWLISIGGQDTYALFQCFVCSCSFCGAIHVKHKLNILGLKDDPT